MNSDRKTITFQEMFALAGRKTLFEKVWESTTLKDELRVIALFYRVMGLEQNPEYCTFMAKHGIEID